MSLILDINEKFLHIVLFLPTRKNTLTSGAKSAIWSFSLCRAFFDTNIGK